MTASPLRVGLIVNPVAGVGGAVALKGSDTQATQRQARERGGQARGAASAQAFLESLLQQAPNAPQQMAWYSWGSPMGAQLLRASTWRVEVCGAPHHPTSAADTVMAAAVLAEDVDLIVFVGGDGTARDIFSAVGSELPVLGIPAGVKMHSGVFAVTPRAGAAVLKHLLTGDLVAPVMREVRDFDTSAPVDDGFAVRHYGDLLVPEVGGYLQQTKVGGKESEPLAVEEICAEVLERLDLTRPLVIAPGSTCARIKQALQMPVTLRGVDVRYADGSVAADVSAVDVEGLVDAQLVVSFTRQQGFLFGRGNQQLSAAFLKTLRWPQDVLVVGTRTKLATCEGRPLLVDTQDAQLDARLSGLVSIITGYQDAVLHRVADVATP